MSVPFWCISCETWQIVFQPIWPLEGTFSYPPFFPGAGEAGEQKKGWQFLCPSDDPIHIQIQQPSPSLSDPISLLLSPGKQKAIYNSPEYTEAEAVIPKAWEINSPAPTGSISMTDSPFLRHSFIPSSTHSSIQLFNNSAWAGDTVITRQTKHGTSYLQGTGVKGARQ